MQSVTDLENTLIELQWMINNTINPIFADLQNSSQALDPVILSHDTMIEKINEMILFLNSGVIQGLKGDKGDQGIQGVQGDQGANGLDASLFPSKIPSDAVIWCEDISLSTSYTLSANPVYSLIEISRSLMIKGFSVIVGSSVPLGDCYIALLSTDSNGCPLSVVAQTDSFKFTGTSPYSRFDKLIPSPVLVPSGSYLLAIVSNSGGTIFGAFGFSMIRKLSENPSLKIRFYNSGYLAPVSYAIFGPIVPLSIGGTTSISPAIGLLLS